MEITQDILLAACNLLKGYFSVDCSVKSTEVLSEPTRRNVILRLHLESVPGTAPSTVILKQSLREEGDNDDKDAYARFARDWAGLQFLNQFETYGHVIPKFYGGNQALRFILQEDLGFKHVSLVDALTGKNKKEAIAALNRFIHALGSMHAASFGHIGFYRISSPNWQ